MASCHASPFPFKNEDSPCPFVNTYLNTKNQTCPVLNSGDMLVVQCEQIEICLICDANEWMPCLKLIQKWILVSFFFIGEKDDDAKKNDDAKKKKNAQGNNFGNITDQRIQQSTISKGTSSNSLTANPGDTHLKRSLNLFLFWVLICKKTWQNSSKKGVLASSFHECLSLCKKSKPSREQFKRYSWSSYFWSDWLTAMTKTAHPKKWSCSLFKIFTSL